MGITTINSGIWKTIYYKGSYMGLFGKRKRQNFEILNE